MNNDWICYRPLSGNGLDLMTEHLPKVLPVLFFPVSADDCQMAMAGCEHTALMLQSLASCVSPPLM